MTTNGYHTAARVDPKPFWKRIDWPLVAATAGLVLVLLLAYGAIRNYEVREAEAANKDALIAELSKTHDSIDRLQQRLARIQDDAAAERARGQRERLRLLRQQNEMIRLLRGLGIDTSEYDGVVVLQPRSQPAGGSSGPQGPQRPRRDGQQRPERPQEAPRDRPATPQPPQAPQDEQGPVRDFLDDVLELPGNLL